MMKVYIVVRNEKIDSVFLAPEQAQNHIDSIKGWNLWEIVEKDIEGTLL
jgi:hypothetical protein